MVENTEPSEIDRVQRIADELIDTAKSLHDVEGGEDLTTEEVARLDELCFCCDKCGWWARADELNNDTDDLLCLECADDIGYD